MSPRARRALGPLFQPLSDLKQWARSWYRHRRSHLPLHRIRLNYELARRRAFSNGPMYGNVLQSLREGRLEVGEGVLFNPGALVETHEGGRVSIGRGTLLNLDAQVAAIDRVDIGEGCLIAPRCFIADQDHRFDQTDRWLNQQGLVSRGPVRIGDHVWLGANVVVTSGVTIGERCVVGANSVVTRDLPPYSIAVGAPARVVGSVDAAGAGAATSAGSPAAARAAGLR